MEHPGFNRPLLSNGIRSVFSCNELVDAVCKYLDVEREEVISSTRKVRVVYPRHLCLYLLCYYSDLTLSDIGKGLGLKQHTSVVHARNNIAHELKKNINTQYKDDISTIILRLGLHPHTI